MDIAEVQHIRKPVGIMLAGVNSLSPWLIDGVVPLADCLLMGFETDYGIMVDAMLEEFSPTGKLPITFPIDAAAAAIVVDQDGHHASPNDVPGLAKEQHTVGRP